MFAALSEASLGLFQMNLIQFAGNLGFSRPSNTYKSKQKHQSLSIFKLGVLQACFLQHDLG